MKFRILIIAIISTLLFACNSKQNVDLKPGYFGSNFNTKKAIDMLALDKLMATKGGSNDVVVNGRVTGVCKKKGCWMTIAQPNGGDMRVRFKDYGFFMPMDIENKMVTMRGKVYNDTTSVEMLRHYAEDAGKNKAEIMKITEPEINIAFEAIGVYLN